MKRLLQLGKNLYCGLNDAQDLQRSSILSNILSVWARIYYINKYVNPTLRIMSHFIIAVCNNQKTINRCRRGAIVGCYVLPGAAVVH